MARLDNACQQAQFVHGQCTRVSSKRNLLTAFDRLGEGTWRSIVIADTAEAAFDPKAFLATVSRGHTVSDLRKDDVIFPQAAAADAVFYVLKGKIKIVVDSEQGKEAVVAILGPASSSAKAA